MEMLSCSKYISVLCAIIKIPCMTVKFKPFSISLIRRNHLIHSTYFIPFLPLSDSLYLVHCISQVVIKRFWPK